MDSVIKTFDFKKGLPLEFEIKELRDIKKDPRLFSYPKRAAFYQLLWLEKGEANFFIDFREINVKEKEAILISVNQIYGLDIVSSYEGKAILFTETFFNQTELDGVFLHSSNILNPLYLNEKIHFPEEYMEGMFKMLDKELTYTRDVFQPCIVQGALRMILLEAERLITQDSQKSPHLVGSNVIHSFFREVEKNFKKNRQVEYYIQQLAVYEKTLSKELKHLIGKTPKQYIDARVILEAKRMLTYSDLYVKEIAIELGWDDSTNFSKFFKKNTGITPLDFRKNKI